MRSGNFHFRRTRLAPTPSGFLHLGNALSFILTVGIARRSGASVLLRIDDLDRERVRMAYVEDIFDTLTFLGIQWDEGPRNVMEYRSGWSQMDRLTGYEGLLAQLARQKAVFACSCKRTDSAGYSGTCRDLGIPLDTGGHGWRFSPSDMEHVPVRLIDGSVTQCSPDQSMNHAIIRRKDGLPSYQVASIFDDLHFGVDLVIRGEDLLPSTLFQIQLARCAGKMEFLDTSFLHHPLIRSTDQTKLSKTAGDTSISGLRREGLDRLMVLRKLADAAGIEGPYGSWEELFDPLYTLWVNQA